MSEHVKDQTEHRRCNDLRRWKLTFGRWFSIRLHHWVEGDPAEYQHTHPWPFVTFVLWGGYDDYGAGRPTDYLRAPAVRYRDTDWRHSVTRVRPHTWTLVVMGKAVKDWRFWMHGRRVDREQWNGRVCD